MKISSDISKNFFLIYSEARGFATRKNKIIKKNKINKLGYFSRITLVFIFWWIIGFILLLKCDSKNCVLPSVILCLDVTFYLLLVVRLFLISIFRKKRLGYKTSITINKKGLIDNSFYNIEMTFGWDLIKAIVVGKYSVVIFTDTPCYFTFDKSELDNILKALEKYEKEVKIIKN